jgi:hypothetical protein
MSNIVEQILKNEIEILKSRFLPEDTGHLRTAVSVLEERIKELPVSDQAYLTMHNIQLSMMEELAKKLDTGRMRDDVWDRQWAVEQALKFAEKKDVIVTSKDVMDTADKFLTYVNKNDK